MRIKSLADINSRKFRRPVAILTLPIVLVAFVIDCLFGIWELAKKNIEYFIWVWKMPSGMKGQQSPPYPKEGDEGIKFDDMTMVDVVEELDKLQATGIKMPYLSGEDAEVAGKRLDKKLKNVKTMKEAVGIMIEDIKENQKEHAVKEGCGLPAIADKDVPPMPKVKPPKQEDQAKDDYDEVAPGYADSNPPKAGPRLVLNEPDKIVPSGDDPHAAEEAVANESAAFQAKLDEVRNAPHTLEEINEIKRQPDDVQRAKAVQRIGQRRVKKFLADTVLDGCVDKLADHLKKAMPDVKNLNDAIARAKAIPSMSVGDAKDLAKDIEDCTASRQAIADLDIEDPPEETEKQKVADVLGVDVSELSTLSISPEEANKMLLKQSAGVETIISNSVMPGEQHIGDPEIKGCGKDTCQECSGCDEQADSPDQSGFHTNEIKSQVQSDDRAEG
jgi:hypothetical protein